ncbi:uncharacterized protein N7500_001214 [Penicillium coprophilum]|uniref:uncharacterized protein n=1 Tax=Penicillium coprophilum TaxID=36646 RepID=UPI0023A43024|nr:uncharacterized protein N7500_001214 [Penicillium coprophilum]KAJ5178515.1 hypothetical protein N7500_001214 [Penicillium coprophilum]
MLGLERRQVQIQIGEGEKERKKWDKSEIRSESWELLAKEKKASERGLWEICPERSILGKGGIRQPRHLGPTLAGIGSWLAEGGRAPIEIVYWEY